MTDKEIKERLEGASEKAYLDGSWAYTVRLDKAQVIAEKIRDKICADMQAKINELVPKLAAQEAKIYAYEAIIANSNFKAALPRTKGREK